MLISLNNISFEFGGRYLYKDSTWQINEGEKIGLIGANGTGKSTLLRIIDGQYSIESGTISRPKNLRIGFLNQDLLSYNSNDSILHVAMEAFEEALKLEDEINGILAKIETDHSEEILHKLHDKQMAYEALDGYNLHHKTEALLEGLGFSTEDLKRPLNTFSGGWRMRVMLAKIILQKPDILLLDEPTNHLDLPAIQWIEKYLVDYEGTIIIVSHDRYFLDNIVNRIAEVANESITIYTGNYSDFLEMKSERDALQKARFENQQQFINQQQRLIDRFKAKASKAKMAQSRVKMLNKIERIEDVASDGKEVRVRFDTGAQPGKVIATLNVDDKSYDVLNILKHTRAQISRGDKIALIGANGRGKSTMLRMINGSESFKGTLEPGYNVTTSFYAQHQLESLNLDVDPITELAHFAPEKSDGEIRKVLGAFLFSGDDVFKKIKVLSGGEKSRVALAKIVLSQSNFLLLDEPTNHLDMKTVNILINILQEYEGSFVVVSHDRYFLSEIANKIWWIENKEVKEFPGTYDEFEYMAELRARDKKEEEKKKEIKKEKVAEPKPEPKKENEELKKKVSKLNKKINQLDEKISQLKTKVDELEVKMSQPDVYAEQQVFQKLLAELNGFKQQLNDHQADWEKTFEELSQTESQL